MAETSTQTRTKPPKPSKPGHGYRALSEQECPDCSDHQCVIYIDGLTLNLCVPKS